MKQPNADEITFTFFAERYDAAIEEVNDETIRS